MSIILTLVFVATVCWVNLDAKAMRDENGRVGSMTRVGWTWSVILLWIIFFPFYLWQRSKMPKVWER